MSHLCEYEEHRRPIQENEVLSRHNLRGVPRPLVSTSDDLVISSSVDMEACGSMLQSRGNLLLAKDSLRVRMLDEVKREIDTDSFAADEIFFYGFEVTHLPTQLTWRRWERYSSLRQYHNRLQHFVDSNSDLSEQVEIDDLGRLTVSLDAHAKDPDLRLPVFPERRWLSAFLLEDESEFSVARRDAIGEYLGSLLEQQLMVFRMALASLCSTSSLSSGSLAGAAYAQIFGLGLPPAPTAIRRVGMHDRRSSDRGAPSDAGTVIFRVQLERTPPADGILVLSRPQTNERWGTRPRVGSSVLLVFTNDASNRVDACLPVLSPDVDYVISVCAFNLAGVSAEVSVGLRVGGAIVQEEPGISPPESGGLDVDGRIMDHAFSPAFRDRRTLSQDAVGADSVIPSGRRSRALPPYDTISQDTMPRVIFPSTSDVQTVTESLNHEYLGSRVASAVTEQPSSVTFSHRPLSPTERRPLSTFAATTTPGGRPNRLILSAPPAQNGATETIGEQESEQLCCLCMENPRTHAFVPCGHKVICASCGDQIHKRLGTCPVCRVATEACIRIFDD